MVEVLLQCSISRNALDKASEKHFGSQNSPKLTHLIDVLHKGLIQKQGKS